MVEQSRQQWEQRQACHVATAATAKGLPAGCPAAVVIAVMRQMIMAPDRGPEQWARQLQSQGWPVTVTQVRQVQEHYAWKKNDKLSLSTLLQAVREQATQQIQQAACLPKGVCFHFDRHQEAAAGVQFPAAPLGGVQKTTRRTVVSLRHGRFDACETVRHQAGPSGARSALLAAVVPSGARHAFDLIAHVGVQTYLHGRRLEDLREELAGRQPPLEVPLSTLWDQQQRFLFYFGTLHRQAAPQAP